MLKSRIFFGACGIVGMGLVAGGGYWLGMHREGLAYADTSTATQMAASAAGAPAVPGLCVLSQTTVYADTKVGESATARYRQLTAAAQAELAPEQKAVQDEAKQLESQKGSLTSIQFQQRQQALAQRVQALQFKANLRSRELEATRLKAVKQIAAWANPVIAAAYQSHHCGALISRDTLLAGNPGMDLTKNVVDGLNEKVTTISFNQEHLNPASISSPTTSR